MNLTIIAMIIFLLLTMVAGSFVGATILKKYDNRKPDGLLNVDTRDPDKDYYDFVFLIPTGDIPKKKFLTIEVKTKS